LEVASRSIEDRGANSACDRFTSAVCHVPFANAAYDHLLALEEVSSDVLTDALFGAIGCVVWSLLVGKSCQGNQQNGTQRELLQHISLPFLDLGCVRGLEPDEAATKCGITGTGAGQYRSALVLQNS